MGYDLSNEASEIWRQVHAIMKNELSEISYQTWLSNIELTTMESGSVVLTTAYQFNKAILESRYLDLINKAFYTITSKQYNIEIKTAAKKPAATCFDPGTCKFSGNNLLPEYTFNNFVIGGCNRMAV